MIALLAAVALMVLGVEAQNIPKGPPSKSGLGEDQFAKPALNKELPEKSAEAIASGTPYLCERNGAQSGSQPLKWQFFRHGEFGDSVSVEGDCPGSCFAISCSCYSTTDNRTIISHHFTQIGNSKGCRCKWRNAAGYNAGWMMVGAHCY